MQADRPSEAEVTSEIEARWAAFIESWEAGDAQACAEFYTQDAVNIPPGFQINRGREAIMNFYADMFSSNTGSDYSHTILKLEYSGNQATELGEFEVEWVTNEGEGWSFKARSMAHWVRDTDGEWRIRMFLFNNPPEESL